MTKTSGSDVVTFRREDGVAENFHHEQNRELLQRLAEETGGHYYQPQDAGRLADSIAYSEAGITGRETKDLWDMPIVFFGAILLRVGRVAAAAQLGGRMSRLWLLAFTALLLAANADAASYYLTVAGLGGDPDYEKQFQKWAADLDKALQANGPDTHTTVLSRRQLPHANTSSKR